jgi:L-threonylcarbamoyladenylate synthase
VDVLPASTQSLAQAIQILKAGGVVAHATETCYGLTCDLTNPTAIKKLFDIKARPYSQPVSALFATIDEAKNYVEFSPRALELAKKYLPGPLTLVLPMRADVPEKIAVVGEGSAPTIGVRISPHAIALALAQGFGKPIATTSANVHSQPNPYSVADLQSQFGSQKVVPDLTLDSGVIAPEPPSTVVEVIGDTVKVLRQGDIKI